jgi:predicted AlkP superfamily pyrophosphatase or phosphodiesterase
MIRKTIFLFTIVLALSATLFCSQSAKPKLSVLVVVDQMRPDYLTRAKELYTGGFKRLLQNGYQLTETYHEHAVTETGVGHATISTGCFPAHHGIVANDWWDRSKARWVYCVEDSTSPITGHPGLPGRSPANLEKMSVGDWLKRASPGSKVFTVSGKDRAAILMGGLQPNGAYWYNRSDGSMVTSIYYTPVFPAWVDSFNAERPADDYFVGIWDRLLPRDKYTGDDSVAAEADGVHTAFPHDFTPSGDTPPIKYYSELLYTPFADQLILRFARNLVLNEQLGADSLVDLLMISCSAGDYIGHRYGPSSHEIQDEYFRLDGYLGSFFAFLDSTVGVNQYVVALTSDHGVLPLPEELQKRGFTAGRLNSDSIAAEVKRVGASIAAQIKCKDNVVLQAGDGIILNYAAAATQGLGETWLRKTMAVNIKPLSFVVDAFTKEELASEDEYNRPFFTLYHNNFNPERSPDIMLRFKEYWIISDEPHGTSHGTPYPYDTHVPLIFYGPGIARGQSKERVATVDIAPTLSDLMGISPPANIDGKTIVPLLGR